MYVYMYVFKDNISNVEDLLKKIGLCSSKSCVAYVCVCVCV